MRRWKNLPGRVRWPLISLGVVAVLFVVGAVLDRTLDEPLRKDIERRFNENLAGYTARVEHVDFHLLSLALDVEDLVVSQDEYPDPPVLVIPKLTATVHVRGLLRARLVADFTFESPSVYANLVQLKKEATDDVPFREHGWQEAFQSIYPLKINELRIRNGALVYREESDARPLEATGIELLATNIRNIHSKDRDYPSTLRADGILFDNGAFSIDGQADFLAKPIPGVKVAVDLERVELNYFEPVLRRYNLRVRKGVLDGHGVIEYASTIKSVDLETIEIHEASVDFLYSSVPNKSIETAKKRITTEARRVMNEPESLFRVQNLVLEDGTIGFVNRDARPSYRVFVSGADFRLVNLSSRAEDGEARASLRGSFMGTGQVQGDASFFPEGKEANFGMRLKIADTQLKPMNEMLKAHGGFDVVGGVFSVYTNVRVKDGYINGYVKPMFRDVDVYDEDQDKKKNVFKQAYEGVVGGVMKMLENKRRDEVVTVANISGPVQEANSNALQVIARLIQNAFIKAILPGFEQEYRSTDPLGYKKAKKRFEKTKTPDKSS